MLAFIRPHSMLNDNCEYCEAAATDDDGLGELEESPAVPGSTYSAIAASVLFAHDESGPEFTFVFNSALEVDVSEVVVVL